MIPQTISGAIQMYNLPIDLLAPRNPVCGITGVGFAFPSYNEVWAAMDGDLGKMLRGVVEGMGLLLHRQDLGSRLPPDHHASTSPSTARRTC